jgi:hypothetical protein
LYTLYLYDRKYTTPDEFKYHLIPYNTKWEACPWSFDVRPVANFTVKWDEYRTSYGYAGTLYRVDKPYGHATGYSELDVISNLFTKRQMFLSHPLNLTTKDWDKLCINRKIVIADKVFYISAVSCGYDEPMLHLVNENGDSTGGILLDHSNVDWYGGKYK